MTKPNADESGRTKNRILVFAKAHGQCKTQVLPGCRSHRLHQLAVSLVIICMLLVGAASSFAAEPSFGDVQYAQVGDQRLLLDLYCPVKSEAPCPLVVWVHGGAWRSGSKNNPPILKMLESGFAIASIDYRLTPIAKFPAQIHDIKAAIRFLRASAQRNRLDAQQFVIAGSSAGGHLAALVGVSNGVQALEGTVGEFTQVSSDVQAIVSFFGAANLQTILAQSTPHGLSVRVPALELLLGGQPDTKSELARQASPVAHVDSADPPLWLIHGDQDPQMPINQSHELVGAYEQFKLPVDFAVVHGGKHGGKEFFDDERLQVLCNDLKRVAFLKSQPAHPGGER